jgi:hypothetical protein
VLLRSCKRRQERGTEEMQRLKIKHTEETKMSKVGYGNGKVVLWKMQKKRK